MSHNHDPYRKLIIALSVLIPITIAALFRVKIEGYDTSFLPPIYATINGITALLLVAGYLAIRSKRIVLHRRLMKSCIALSASFLIMYVIYHMTSDSTPYEGTGWIRGGVLFHPDQPYRAVGRGRAARPHYLLQGALGQF